MCHSDMRGLFFSLFPLKKLLLSALVSYVKSSIFVFFFRVFYFFFSPEPQMTFRETKLAFVRRFREAARSCHVHVKLIRRKY